MEYLEPEVGTFQIRSRLVRGTADARGERQPLGRRGGPRRDQTLGGLRPAERATMSADASRKSQATLT
jgi:hypothetical protein